MRSNDPLLQSFRLKHLTLKNRIISTAHEPNYHDGHGMPGERYRLYHVEKAKGGIAMTMTAGSASVARDSPPAFGNLLAYKDEIVPHLRRLADDCHEHGCAVMIQLTHLGRRTGWNKADWLPVLAPSPVREPAHRAFPKTIEDWDIERIIADYASATQRMQAAGLDGIEFEAYGHLLDQFWSPATNRREDEYGGSIDNRLRFTFRVLDAVRKAVRPDFIVGLRLVVDEDWRQGLSREEGLEIARRLIATGQIDFLNVIRGHIDSDPALTKVIPVHGMRAAPHLDFAGEVKAQTKFPVFHAARIADVATARHAVASGKLDLVGMTRAHIADPHIVRKIEQGVEHEIRPCVGATYCLDRIYEAGEALCIHNAATGREAMMPHVIARSQGATRKAVVVGAGPAGLEAARVLAERGHHVTLFEAADRPGGQIRLITQLARRREFVGIVDWRMARLESRNVRLVFNTLAEAQDVLAEEPDLVIIATGGLPQRPPIEAGGDLTVSTWDILSGDVKPADDILLYDDNGAHPGLTAAQFLVEHGAELEVVSPERMFFPDVGGMNVVPYLAALQTSGARLTIGTMVRAIRREGNKLAVTLASEYAERDLGERLVDQVVVEHGTLPLDELYFALKDQSVNRGAVDYDALVAGRPQQLRGNPDGLFQLFRIGDAVASRNIHAAIYDALRLCKDL
ncbi:NADH:flavin oxidoreductase [Rhodoligotrophos ferricapiens]|uniref:NADH:flavin oxidoreductase n=1 Tax=Rhodoligotrophos ferricapiens TaxID=3069264 RepID=UPI00315D1EB9